MPEPLSDVLGRLNENPGEATAEDVTRLLGELEERDDAIRAAWYANSQSESRERQTKEQFLQYQRDSAKPMYPGEDVRVYVSITDHQGEFARVLRLPQHWFRDLQAYRQMDAAAEMMQKVQLTVAEAMSGWIQARGRGLPR
jgi:hypothetical protein